MTDHSNRTPEIPATKLCRGCGVVKPTDAFSRDRGARDGLYARCKACDQARYRADYAVHAEARRACRRRYNATHAPALRSYFRVYYQANADSIRSRQRRYRAANPEQVAAKVAVQRAIRQGELAHPATRPCAVCHAPATEYHHYLGYAPEHQLAVTPLCRSCHRRAHTALRGHKLPVGCRRSPSKGSRGRAA